MCDASADGANGCARQRMLWRPPLCPTARPPTRLPTPTPTPTRTARCSGTWKQSWSRTRPSPSSVRRSNLGLVLPLSGVLTTRRAGDAALENTRQIPRPVTASAFSCALNILSGTILSYTISGTDHVYGTTYARSGIDTTYTY
eukprot:3939552-Rhodomonas_salina.1